MSTKATSSKSIPSHQNAESWTRFAPDYKIPSDDFVRELLGSIVSSLDAVRPLSGPNTFFLDDGCGTGNLIAHLIETRGASLSNNARILGTDFSSGMIEQLEKRRDEETDPLWRRVEARVEDAMDLSGIADNSITHVGSAMCVFLVPEPAQAIAEAYRVLTPGGGFAFSTFKKVLFEDAMAAIESVRPERTMPIQLVPQNMKSEAGVISAMQEAGFVNVKTTLLKMPLPMPKDKKKFWTMFLGTRNPALEEFFKNWSEEEMERAVEAIVKDLEEKRIDVLEGETIMVAGMKPQH